MLDNTVPLPLALYVGPAHVLADVNQTWLDVYGFDPPLGVPAVEAFEGPGWLEFVRAMDDAWSSGQRRSVPCDPHESHVVILPLWERGRVVALVTGCGLEKHALMPASRPLPLPTTARVTAAP